MIFTNFITKSLLLWIFHLYLTEDLSLELLVRDFNLVDLRTSNKQMVYTNGTNHVGLCSGERNSSKRADVLSHENSLKVAFCGFRHVKKRRI